MGAFFKLSHSVMSIGTSVKKKTGTGLKSGRRDGFMFTFTIVREGQAGMPVLHAAVE